MKMSKVMASAGVLELKKIRASVNSGTGLFDAWFGVYSEAYVGGASVSRFFLHRHVRRAKNRIDWSLQEQAEGLTKAQSIAWIDTAIKYAEKEIADGVYK